MGTLAGCRAARAPSANKHGVVWCGYKAPLGARPWVSAMLLCQREAQPGNTTKRLMSTFKKEKRRWPQS